MNRRKAILGLFSGIVTLSVGALLPMKLGSVRRTRTFVPATVQDNPYLAGTDYEQTLLALPEPYRSQMLFGDFRDGWEDDPIWTEDES